MVMALKTKCIMGWGYMPLMLRPDLDDMRPQLLRKEYNTREATDEAVQTFITQCGITMGGLSRDSWRFAVVVMVKAKCISNLEEIKKWRPGSGDPLVEIKWTKNAGNADMHILNGNHRYETAKALLQEQLKKLNHLQNVIIEYRTTTTHTEKQTKDLEACQRDMSGLWDIVEDQTGFCIELYDQGGLAFHLTMLRK